MILPVLQTARLLLNPFEAEDGEMLHALWTDPDIRRHLWDDEVIPPARAAATVDAAIESARASGVGMWTLRAVSAPSILIGFGGLRPLPDGTAVELLYGLRPDCWGRGLATDASEAILRYAFGTLALPRVLGGADASNGRSLGVMQRLGMTPLPDAVPGLPGATYYSIERAAYFARARPVR